MFDRLFSRRGKGLQHQADTAELAADFAIHASLEELIGLRLQARQLSLKQNVPASHLMAGNHVSHFKGRGMDYMESRGYQPGDDIRNMDWRITARTGRPHIKLFQEERQRPVMLMVDLNESMFFASRGRFKSAIAAQTAALLAWSANHKGDRVGGLLVNHEHHEIADRNGRKGVLALLQEITDRSAVIETSQPITADNAGRAGDSTRNQVSFNDGLKRLLRLSRPGSLVFLISDFLALNQDSRSLLSQLKKNRDLVAIQVLDQLEKRPPPPGLYHVTDGLQTYQLDTSNPQQVNHYQQLFQQHQQLLYEYCSQLGLPHIQIATHQNPLEVLKAVFARRSLFKGTRR